MDKDKKKDFRKEAIIKEERHLKFRTRATSSVLQGFKICGMIGWSVILPVALAIPIGLWLDLHTHKGSYRYTLVALLAGLTFGCIFAAIEISRAISNNNPSANNHNHGSSHDDD